MDNIISMETKHTINIMLANKPGMLVRVALIFSKRGFNIDSLAVGPKHNNRLSLMTITCTGCIDRLKDITKVLARLIDVLDVKICDEKDIHHQELLFVRVKNDHQMGQDAHFSDLIQRHNVKSIQMDDNSMILQMTDHSTQVDHFLEKINHYGIVETVRSGRISMNKKQVV